MKVTRFGCALVLLSALSGCVTAPGQAAREAVTSPGTWVPLLGAALLMVDDQDAKLTEWAIREQPLFGDDAQSRSDDLEALLGGAYLISALAVPNQGAGEKAKSIGVGAATVVLEGGITKGLKRTIKRQRPNGRNGLSMPSGTAGRASVLATMTASNVQRMHWSPAGRRAAQGMAHAMSYAAAWSRLEAGKHHASDVLVGNAIGHFLARFMERTLLWPDSSASIQFSPLMDGGAVTLSVEVP